MDEYSISSEVTTNSELAIRCCINRVTMRSFLTGFVRAVTGVLDESTGCTFFVGDEWEKASVVSKS